MKKYLFLIGVFTLVVSCSNETCADGVQNQNETGVDCGGQCSPCGTCTDGIQNQDETGVDCGGVCSLCDIEYDSTSVYGPNILFGDDSLHLGVGYYSFQANMKEGSSLTIELDIITGESWFYNPATNNGWSVSAFDGQGQTFTLMNTGNFNLEFELIYSPNPSIVDGSFYIHYYENGSALTKTKYIYWD